MMRWIPLFALFACTPTDSATPVDTDPGDTDVDPPGTPLPEPCTAVVVAIDPADGAVDVPVGSAVVATFDLAITEANAKGLSLSAAGTNLPGVAELAADGLSLVFTPASPLPELTEITVQAEVCGQAFPSVFTTGHGPVPAAQVEGRTWAVDYGAIAFTSPTIAETLTPADWILIQAVAVDEVAQTLDTAAGLGNGATPLPDCANAFDTGPADFAANPALAVGPTDFTLPFGADLVTIEDFEVAGRVGPGGGTLHDLVLLGNLDTRGITAIDNVCQLSAILGSPCGPCRDGVPRCLAVEATAAQADAWPGLDLAGVCAL